MTGPYNVVAAVRVLGSRIFGGAGNEGGEPPVEPQPSASPRRKHLAGVIIAATLFAIYVGNGDAAPGNDASPNVYLAATLLSRGTLAYTPESNPLFFRWTLAHDGELVTGTFRSWDDPADGRTMRQLFREGRLFSPVAFYYLARTTQPGIYVPVYGAATGLFALPFVAAVYPFVKDLPERPRLLWFLCKLAASFAVAGSAWFLFLIAADHMRLSSAVLLTLSYGLATSVWSVSSQTLWQHAPGELFLALGMFCLFRRKQTYAPYLAGFAFGLAFMCRPTNSLAVAAGLLFLLSDRRAALAYLLGGVPVAIAFFAYNLHFFGTLISFGQVSTLAERIRMGDTAALWQYPFAKGLAGVLVSPSRGIFVYSPILLVSLWASFRIWKERRWIPLRAAALAAVGIWVVTARWMGWWGGWSYGYRMVVDSAILLAFLAIPVVESIRRRRGLAWAVGALLLWSVGVQALGAFVYDLGGWNNQWGYVVLSSEGRPGDVYFTTKGEAGAYCHDHGCSYKKVHLNVDIRRYSGRLWSIGDSQILYYLQNVKPSVKRKAAYLRELLGPDGRS